MIEFVEGGNSLLYLIASYTFFLSLTLGAFLLFAKSSKNKANRFLGTLLLLMSLYPSTTFFASLGILDDFPHIIRLYTLGGCLIGPLVYFYIRSCTQKDFKMRLVHWLNFIPFLLNVLYLIPFLSLSGAEKYAEHLNFFRTGSLGTPPLLLLSKVIHSLFYFFVSTVIIHQYKDHLTNTASFIDKGFHRWLILFSCALLLPLLTIAIFSQYSLNLNTLTMIQFSILCFLFSVYIAVLSKPALFHPFPHKMLLPESEELQVQKYENSNLQETQKDAFVRRLVEYVESNKSYEKPELSLAELAENVKIPTHYLSQVINEKMDCNFLDFINSYRIRDAKEKLINPEFSHFTIISIAYEVGFNSKTAFYTAFKKHAGTTPGAYRKSSNDR